MGLREAAKQKRRRRILEAAEQLVSEEGLDALSMRRLAECAQLSTRTLYNLYGAKEDIVFALMAGKLEELDRALDELSLDDPIQRSRMLITADIERLLDREDLHRSLLHDVDLRPRRPREFVLMSRARALQEEAVQAAMEAGMLDDRFSSRVLAHQILMGHGQSVRLWARGVLSPSELLTQSLHAWALCLSAAATDRTREQLHREVLSRRAEVEGMIDRLQGMALSVPELSESIEPHPAGGAA